MSRLQRKCFVASTTLHALLVVVIVFGSGFLTSKEAPPPRSIEPLTFIPSRLIPKDLSGGGNPNVAPPPEVRPAEPEPTPPAPVPPPPMPAREEVRPTPPRSVEPEPERVPPAKAREPAVAPEKKKPAPKDKARAEATASSKATNVVKNLPKVDLTKVVKRGDTDAGQAAQVERERKIRSQRMGDIARGIRERAGSGISVSVESFGPGGGGESYASYDQWVFTAYDRAWRPSPSIADNDSVAKALVVVGRDGRVKSSKITHSSGSAAMDRSVQRALDEVAHDGLPPFPSESRGLERSFNIEFNLKAKRLTG
jgi:TonB family protein